MYSMKTVRMSTGIKSTFYDTESTALVTKMSNRTSVYSVVMLGVVYHKVIDVGCFSHTLDKLREKCNEYHCFQRALKARLAMEEPITVPSKTTPF